MQEKQKLEGMLNLKMNLCQLIMGLQDVHILQLVEYEV